MKNKSIFKNILLKGRLVVSYTLLREIGLLNAIVFSRILAEYLFAINNDGLLKNSYFAFDIKEISRCLGISTDDVQKSIKDLENYKFISTLKIDEFCLLYIDEECVLDFVVNRDDKNWDDSLAVIQEYAYFYFMNNEAKQDLIPTDKQSYLYEIATDENGNSLCF